MKKTILICVLTCGLQISGYAQGLIGFKAGVGISSFRNTKVPSGTTADSYSSILVPQVGIMFNAKLGDVITLRPELLYMQRGAQNKDSGMTTTTRISYAELPFNVVAGIRAGSFKIEMFAGPAVGYAFGGTQKVSGPNGYNKTYTIKGGDQPSTPDGNIYVNYLNISMNAGVGFKFKRMVVQASYNLGFSNLNPHVSDRNSPAETARNNDVLKASSINFGLAYLFGGKED